MARSSAADSAFTIYDLLLKRLEEHKLAARARSSGISICASTEPFRTPGSAWVWSAASPGSAGWSTCAKRSPIRACCTARGRNEHAA